jgi:hypothetical protein
MMAGRRVLFELEEKAATPGARRRLVPIAYDEETMYRHTQRWRFPLLSSVAMMHIPT